VATRPETPFKGRSTLAIGFVSVGFATFVTAVLALTTAIRPQPWFDPHYAIPLAGIILGSVLNSASLSLDSFLGSVRRERQAIEARLSLGESYREAIAPLVREAIRRGLLPIINQMSAAGIVTLPGIMTGQILAGLDYRRWPHPIWRRGVLPTTVSGFVWTGCNSLTMQPHARRSTRCFPLTTSARRLSTWKPTSISARSS
jgi:Uncharacterised protein family (UPF0014)